MATLRVRASHVPEAWALPRFTGLVTFIGTVFDVFAEAQAMARAAHKRYPFAAW
jgi:hypothetical protein